MNDEMKEAWEKFFGDGWSANEVPDKRQCFVAGYEAAVERVLKHVSDRPISSEPGEAVFIGKP